MYLVTIEDSLSPMTYGELSANDRQGIAAIIEDQVDIIGVGDTEAARIAPDAAASLDAGIGVRVWSPDGRDWMDFSCKRIFD